MCIIKVPKELLHLKVCYITPIHPSVGNANTGLWLYHDLAVRRENLLYETWAHINLQLSRDADEVTGCDGFNGFNGLQPRGKYRSEGVDFRTNKPELNHYKKSH